MVKWFKKLLRIVKNYDADNVLAYTKTDTKLRELRASLHARIKTNEQFIRERTDVSADIHCREGAHNTIIVVGRYRNRDYVEVFSVQDDLSGFISQLRDMQRYATIRHVDAPPSMRAFIDHAIPLENNHG